MGGVPPCSPATVPCTAVGIDGESRAEFDDVDDFDGLDEQPPLDVNGNPRAEHANYRVQISADYLDTWPGTGKRTGAGFRASWRTRWASGPVAAQPAPAGSG